MIRRRKNVVEADIEERYKCKDKAEEKQGVPKNQKLFEKNQTSEKSFRFFLKHKKFSVHCYTRKLFIIL